LASIIALYVVAICTLASNALAKWTRVPFLVGLVQIIFSRKLMPAGAEL
jgi:hypothetical protein